MNNSDLIFTERLKQLRKAHGYTQDELAKQLGIARTSVSGYERGDRKPDLEMLSKIANLFDKPVDYLIGNSNLEKVDDNLLSFLNNLNSSNIEETIVDIYRNESNKNIENDVFKNLLVNFIKLVNKSLNIKASDEETENKLLKLFISCIALQSENKFDVKDLDLLISLISRFYYDSSIKEFSALKPYARTELMKIIPMLKLPNQILHPLIDIIKDLVVVYDTRYSTLSTEFHSDLLIKSMNSETNAVNELRNIKIQYEAMVSNLNDIIKNIDNICEKIPEM